MSLLSKIEDARRTAYVQWEDELANLIDLAEEAIAQFCSSRTLRDGYIPCTNLRYGGFLDAFTNASDSIRKFLFKHLVDQGLEIRVYSIRGNYYFEFLPPKLPEIYKDGFSMFPQKPEQN